MTLLGGEQKPDCSDGSRIPQLDSECAGAPALALIGVNVDLAEIAAFGGFPDC
jgi:hypothetical protein